MPENTPDMPVQGLSQFSALTTQLLKDLVWARKAIQEAEEALDLGLKHKDLCLMLNSESGVTISTEKALAQANAKAKLEDARTRLNLWIKY